MNRINNLNWWKMEARTGIEPVNKGFAALAPRNVNIFNIMQVGSAYLHAVHRWSTWSL